MSIVTGFCFLAGPVAMVAAVARSPSASFSAPGNAGVQVKCGEQAAGESASACGAGKASTAISWNGSFGTTSFSDSFFGPATRVSDATT